LISADNVDPSPALHLWTINTNVLPVAVADNYSIDQDTVLTVPAPGVLGNDSDTDGNSLTAVLDTPPTNGTLNLNADGSFDYTPDAGYIGSDSFSYHANDGTVDSNVVTVEITVNGVTTVFASCGGYDVFEIAPGVYEAPDFTGNLIVGTNGFNRLNGPDLILGLGGVDIIKGKRGDDVICGGNGADIIRGNNGKDTLYGDAGLDWLIGGNGRDILYGGKGWDLLEGKKGQDRLFGEAGIDVLLGGKGNDELDGGSGNDSCNGGPGNDTLSNC
jgi:Ca2+-binding RTX toxin-like protein